MITLIHRQESLSFLGIPLRRFIDVEDSEQVLRAIRLTPDTVPIDLVVHTPGGLVLAAEQIAQSATSPSRQGDRARAPLRDVGRHDAGARRG